MDSITYNCVGGTMGVEIDIDSDYVMAVRVGSINTAELLAIHDELAPKRRSWTMVPVFGEKPIDHRTNTRFYDVNEKTQHGMYRIMAPIKETADYNLAVRDETGLEPWDDHMLGLWKRVEDIARSVTALLGIPDSRLNNRMDFDIMFRGFVHDHVSPGNNWHTDKDKAVCINIPLLYNEDDYVRFTDVGNIKDKGRSELEPAYQKFCEEHTPFYEYKYSYIKDGQQSVGILKTHTVHRVGFSENNLDKRVILTLAFKQTMYDAIRGFVQNAANK